MNLKNLKNSLVNTILFSLLFFNIFCHAGENNNNGLSVGETIPNPEIMPIMKQTGGINIAAKLQDYKEGQNLLIAFMPTITDKNSYAKIMTDAFDTYFAKGLSFGAYYNYYYPNPDLKILVVTGDDDQAVNEFIKDKDFDFAVTPDKNMNIANFFGIKDWNSNGDGSHVYIINKENKIVYANYDYKGEGEKLKTVQSNLYSLLNIKDNVTPFVENNPLMPGDQAKDFSFQYEAASMNEVGKVNVSGKLSDFIGKKNVLIAFYPAAFSISCSMEAKTFDNYAYQQAMMEKVSNDGLKDNSDLEILMVSVSNSSILSQWRKQMGLQNVKLVNDPTGEISMMYNSYNQFGYNKRTIFLVDKEGKISYINWDYQVNDNDFAVMKDRITALK